MSGFPGFPGRKLTCEKPPPLSESTGVMGSTWLMADFMEEYHGEIVKNTIGEKMR